MLEENQPDVLDASQNGDVEELGKWKERLKRIAALAFAVGITAAIFLLRDTIGDYSAYGYPGVFILSVLGNATLIFPAPSFVVVLVLAGVLNPVLLGLSSGIGAAVGEMTGWLAGYSGRGILEEKKLYQRLEELMRRRGAIIIFILAFIPNPLFDVGGIMAGALRMAWWKFLLAAGLGKSIRFTILALVGESLTIWVEGLF